jgi:hypothetical protein
MPTYIYMHVIMKVMACPDTYMYIHIHTYIHIHACNHESNGMS